MNLRVRGAVDVHGRRRDVSIAAGRIADDADGPVLDGPVLDGSGLVLAPGFLDLQVNGAGGVDVTATPERLTELGGTLARHGVTGYLATVITSSEETRREALRAWSEQDPTTGGPGAVALGLHLEGPMIAAARKGAHPEEHLAPPSPGLVERWSPQTGVRMVTLAPELPGAVEVIRVLTARGVLVSIGHTAATGAQTRAAIEAGARCVTHLFNAMPGPAAREPGPVGVALDGGLVAGVIADGHHLAPETLRLAWSALGPERFLAVSDTTAALGLPDGPATLGDQQVVLADGAVRLADGTLAGSAASLADCLRVLRATTGCSLADAVATATTTPADLLGDTDRGRLDPGCRGDLVLLDVAGGGFEVVATVVGGEVVWRS